MQEMYKNKVIFASAGSGKTYSLVKEALKKSENTKKLILLISYTNEGANCLEQELKNQTHFLMNNKIEIKTWYSFLLNECIKPYQCSLDLKSNNTGEYFNIQPNYINSLEFNNGKKVIKRISKECIEYYINENHDVTQDNTSNLACEINNKSCSKLINRLEEIYSDIFIDEVQDYAGWDLIFFEILLNSNINVNFVGDIRQATFRTNRSTKNKHFWGSKIINWFEKMEKDGKCSIIHNNKTRRCNKQICKFVNTIYFDDKENDIEPYDCFDKKAENEGVFIVREKDLYNYCNYYHPTILRWSAITKINDNLNCQIFNYGISKGMTFDRIVIYLTDKLYKFILEQKPIEQDEVKSKFYVACTRAKYSIIFVVNDLKKPNNHFAKDVITLPNTIIECYRFND